MYRKSLLPTAAVVATIPLVAACGTESVEGTGAKASSGAKGATIAFVQGFTTDEYYVTQKCGFESEAKKLGMEPIVDGPANFDPAEQTPVLQAVRRPCSWTRPMPRRWWRRSRRPRARTSR